MNKFLLISSVLVLTAISAIGQAPGRVPPSPNAGNERTGLPPVFMATKDQIIKAQVLLKEMSLYEGEANGKYSKETREAIKSFQADHGLKPTGRLNRATVETMKIPLTGNQRQSPVTADSFATSDSKKRSAGNQNGTRPNTVKFAATKDQIKLAQKFLKANSLFGGKESGKINDDTRDALKKFQEANGLAATGELDRATLEKMEIELTEGQKAIAAIK